MRTYKIMGRNNSYTNFDFMKYMTFLRESDYEVEAKAFELLAEYHPESVRDLAWQFMYNGELPSMEEPDLYWEQESDNRWVLFSHDEDGDETEIAEVGFEDGSYYWVEIDSDCGYEGFDTLDEAKADAEKYFSKH